MAPVSQKNITELLANSNELVLEVSRLVSQITGIQLGERQMTMVYTRLKRRMGDLGIATDKEYQTYLHAHHQSEVEALISLLTTHHTYFFREFAHFEYLIETGIAKAADAAKRRGDHTIRIWSAASSRGQEAYSLAMLFEEYMPRIAPGLRYEILGTDVDPESVKIASNGVYHRREMKEVPSQFLADRWARGTGDISEFVKAKKPLRQNCTFEVSNLLSFQGKATQTKFDIIFCRNVFIYFTQAQIQEICVRLMDRLTTNGELFIGISESLHGLSLNLASLGPSIYAIRHRRAIEPSHTAAEPSAAKVIDKPIIVGQKSRKLRVVCVDDSGSVLKLLEKILASDPGFEVVGTAGNGIEAQKKIRDLKPDLVTLDIHMPEQDGVEYLKSNMNGAHPPVVMVSSVNRDDRELALKCLELGASDFVEKPALANIEKSGEEIRNKLRSAWRLKQNQSAAAISSIDRSFAQTGSATKNVLNEYESIRVVIFGKRDVPKVIDLLTHLDAGQPPICLLVEGDDRIQEEVIQDITKSRYGNGQKIERLQSLAKITSGQILVGTIARHGRELAQLASNRKSLILAYGYTAATITQEIKSLRPIQLLIEEGYNEGANKPLTELVCDVVPHTSFAYMTNQMIKRSRAS